MKRELKNDTFFISEIWLDVEFIFYKGSNFEDDEDEAEIVSVELQGEEITDLLKEEILEQIRGEIFERYGSPKIV